MQLIDCDITHCDAILAILNDAIATSTANYDYKPRTPEMMLAWFEGKRRGNYPVVGAVDSSGTLLGFATYGTFRVWPAYKYTVEHSLYVARPHRGQGLGSRLLEELIRRARAQDYHVLVAGVDSANVASIRLHERFGFEHTGTLQQVGFKFGNWLDLRFYQLILDTPARPVDG